jgi:hypothetical protein
MEVSMEEISMVRKVTKDGLILKNPCLHKFINKKVRVIVTLFEEKKTSEKTIFDLIGAFDDKTIKLLEESLEECRQIDYDEWK